MAELIEDFTGAPCKCGWGNPLPSECLRDEWQREECGGSGCNRQFEYRGWHRPTETDREAFVIQSRPFPYRVAGRFARREPIDHA